MTGRSHLLLTGAAYATLALHPIPTPLGPISVPRLVPGGGLVPTLAGAVAVALVGLLPDVDQAGSKAARLGGWPTRALAWLVQVVLGHRGALHSLVAAFVAWWLGQLVGSALGVPGLAGLAAFGWCAHLLLDAATAGGVPILWPLPLRLRLPPGLSTGGLGEHAALLGVLAVCAWWTGLA